MKPLNRTTYAVIIIGILFFIFGFVTWLNGTLIPFLKLACQLKSDTQAFFVTFAFYMAYFFLAIPSFSFRLLMQEILVYSLPGCLYRAWDSRCCRPLPIHTSALLARFRALQNVSASWASAIKLPAC